MQTRKILIDAFKSDELKYNLEEIISPDDGVPVDAIPDATIVEEARFVLGKFTGESGGFEQEGDLNGDHGPEQQKWARKEVRTLRSFLKKYA